MSFAPTPRQWNRVARLVIVAGGVSIVIAVLAILAFIAREAAPLFGPVRATSSALEPPTQRLPGAPLAAWADDEGELAYELLPLEIVFFRPATGEIVSRYPLAFGDSVNATCAQLDAGRGLLVVGSADGRAALAQANFEVVWKGQERSTVPHLRWLATVPLDSLPRPVQAVHGDRDADGNIAFTGLLDGGGLRYRLLDAAGELVAARSLDDDLDGRQPASVFVSLHGGILVAGTRDGTLYFWNLDDPAEPQLEDHLRSGTQPVTALSMLLGDQTLIVGTEAGTVSTWMRVRYVRARNDGDRTVEVDDAPLAPGEERTVLDRDYAPRFSHVPGVRFATVGKPWVLVHEFAPHPAPVVAVAISPRGRTFATADAHGEIRLHHSTTQRTLLDLVPEGGERPSALAFGPRGARLLATTSGTTRIHAWSLRNPHPEANPRSLLAPVWYEGYVEPKHVWQSTGGTDEFEPKLSLVPLIVGTLKGTLYALLFSVPVAVLAALYVSQLASPRLRSAVKPVIELMAAMPSVVVGFLAALWLAPLLENHLGDAMGIAVGLPAGFLVAVVAWWLLPGRWRQRAKPGIELGFLVPFLLFGVWLGAQIGSPIEARFFAGDVQQWLFDRHGVTYDQRNCIVVGIALGFAVIPIIFTISEDALSAVPRSLTTASLALGASRWQSALHVVLPAASPGIFAAVMLGLGRAIGETMIVLMATGNTPLLDFSPFNGMRTMSAAIAVEIPEAPHGGTLYRVLFLTGFLLFCFTFLLNTVADLVGRRLRKRYGQF